MSAINYRTSGTCSKSIFVEITDGKVTKVEFEGGCSGNTKGVASLVIGMDAKEAQKKLSGITCGMKSTSCPDQLAKAIEKLTSQNQNH